MTPVETSDETEYLKYNTPTVKERSEYSILTFKKSLQIILTLLKNEINEAPPLRLPWTTDSERLDTPNDGEDRRGIFEDNHQNREKVIR